MKKNFRLPKAFAIKWLEALKSGKYVQTNGTLCRFDVVNNCYGYCCLGVGGAISNIDTDTLVGRDIFMTSNPMSSSVPTEIVGDASDNSFVGLVAKLNDGITKTEFNQFKADGIIFSAKRKLNEHKNVFTFKQIAKVIEDNCEFYEPESK